jgi:3-oxoacyl-[acyl-carrier-protein] synthase-3
MTFINSIITGTGVGTPKEVKKNADFYINTFYDKDGERINDDPENIVRKFEQITGINERRYANQNTMASDLATTAAQNAIADAKIDPEKIDYIIVAQNFGDIIKHNIQTDMVPALASRVKHNLGIKNPECVAYDIIFGCPGWIQAMIQADMYIKSGMAKTCLVIGAEALSRVLDPHDRDSMIFADGAGATIVEARESEEKKGIIGHKALSHTTDEAYYIRLGASNFPDSDERVRYIKMDGRKVYEYALTEVPNAMKACLDASGFDIADVKKFFIHQANEKMDEAIVKRLYKLYKNRDFNMDVMPMNIHELGNSSVATIPTLYHQVINGEKFGHQVHENDLVMFASVGAGMNINAILYRY